MGCRRADHASRQRDHFFRGLRRRSAAASGKQAFARNCRVTSMNPLFPDRAKFAHDPLGFLLSKADRASAPIARLRLGFHRIHLLTDLNTLEDRLFCSKSFVLYDSSTNMILPRSAIEKQGKDEDPSTATDDDLKGWTNIIDPIIDIIISELRQTFFTAFRHASIDCWAFANILVTKLTLAAVFGDNALDNTSKRDFARHVELVKFYSDQIALDIVCGRQQHASKKMRLCRLHLQEINSTIATAFARKRVESICGYVYGDSYVRPPRSEEICQLVIGVHQATTNVLFWAISAISQDKCIRSVIEQEADASLLSTGGIDKKSLNALGIARSLCDRA